MSKETDQYAARRLAVDARSLAKLKEAVAKIPPQTMPRAAQNVADLQAAIQRMERESGEK